MSAKKYGGLSFSSQDVGMVLSISGMFIRLHFNVCIVHTKTLTVCMSSESGDLKGYSENLDQHSLEQCFRMAT